MNYYYYELRARDHIQTLHAEAYESSRCASPASGTFTFRGWLRRFFGHRPNRSNRSYLDSARAPTLYRPPGVEADWEAGTRLRRGPAQVQ